jgi:hypothetical protein
VPFTATYSQYLYIGDSLPNAGTTYPPVAPTVTSTTLSDTLDGSDNGSIGPGQQLAWSAAGGTVQLVGTTGTGDPVVWVVGPNSYYVLSNSAFPSFSSMGFTQSTYIMCFAKGTLIATPKGEVAVEALQIGDPVATDGGVVPIKWIGRQTVSTRFGPAERLMPVRFAAGSLGGDLPHTDLTVTADHGMLVEGVICHAGALVNGTTITRVPLAEMGETYTVYHIETEAHEIILANGAPAETFIDNVSRRVFDNYAEFDALYGDVPEMEELPYPRAMSARQVPAHIRAALTHSRAA